MGNRAGRHVQVKGKFIRPEKLEHSLNKDAWVDQAMVFGSGLHSPWLSLRWRYQITKSPMKS